MSEPADLFADAAPAARGVPASSRGGRGEPLDADRVVYVPAPPNPWKAAALVLSGVVGGSLGASIVWSVVIVAASADGGLWLSSIGIGTAYADSTWGEGDTDRLLTLFAADPVVIEHLGTVAAVTMNDPLTYGPAAEGDEYFYDVTGAAADGTETRGIVRVRFVTDDTFHEADLTLPDGAVHALPLADADPPEGMMDVVIEETVEPVGASSEPGGI